MAFSSSVTVKGGDKIKQILANAEKNNGKRAQVKVGIFSDSKYPDGVPIATAGAVNEFGLSGTPERPWMRRGVAEIENDLPKKLTRMVDPETMQPDLDAVGAYAAEKLRESAESLKEPKNAPSTIALKGSANPLVDSGEMLDAITYEVD